MTTKKVRVLAAAALVGVFLLGNVSGAGVALLAVRHRVQRLLEGPPEEVETHTLVFALDRALKLDGNQRASIEAIHRRHLPELNRIRQSSETPLAAERARIAAEIRSVLRPDQQSKFDGMYAKFEARRRRLVGLPADSAH